MFQTSFRKPKRAGAILWNEMKLNSKILWIHVVQPLFFRSLGKVLWYVSTIFSFDITWSVLFVLVSHKFTNPTQKIPQTFLFLCKPCQPCFFWRLNHELFWTNTPQTCVEKTSFPQQAAKHPKPSHVSPISDGSHDHLGEGGWCGPPLFGPDPVARRTTGPQLAWPAR